MRVRSRILAPLQSYTRTHKQWAPTVLPPGVTTGFAKSGQQSIDNMSDVATMRFKTRRSRGEIIMNPLSVSNGSANYPIAPYSARFKKTRKSDGVVTQHTETIATPGYSLSLWDPPLRIYDNSVVRNARLASLGDPLSGAEARTLTKAYAKAAESSALALVSLAEASKTLAMVPKIAADLATLGRFVRHVRPKDLTPRGVFKAGTWAASQWLQYRYGLMPTIMDVESMITVFTTAGKLKRIRFVARESGERIGTATSEPGYSDDSLVTTNGRQFGRIDTVSSGVIVAPVWDSNESVLNSLGFDRIATTAWELVPFSFILDWFVNTSEYIAAREGRFDQKVLGSWTTRSTVLNGSHWMSTSFRNWSDDTYTYAASGVRSYTMTESHLGVARTANPPLSSLPQIRLNLNWKKWTDLAALALQTKSLARNLRL